MSVASAVPRESLPPLERSVGETEAVRRALGLDRRSRWKKRIIWSVVLALVAVGIVFLVLRITAPAPAPKWLTAPVHVGDLTTSVTATGTLKPTHTVDVAAEISGRIIKVAADQNDRVKKGQVLVEIDTERVLSQLAQARAQAEAAHAATREAQATVVETRAEFARAKELAPKGIISKRDLDSASASYARARAHLTSSQAQEKLAAAQVASVQTDVGKAVIVAPIDGIVLTRNIEVGNAVAATFQVPILMTLAEDLTTMELTLDVDEADVGVVKANQTATFVVDAFPERTFKATVVSVLFASKTVSNVVTYPAKLTVDNPEGLLRPGMTTTATITTGVVSGELLVPNAALRFTPPVTGASRTMFSGPAGGAGTLSPEALARQNAPKVYILEGGQPVPMPVVLGVSDGQWTAVKSLPRSADAGPEPALPPLSEGVLVVVGEDKAGATR